MSYNLTQEELHEMRDWSAKAEQLVRLGMIPVSQLPYIKRALKLVQTDAFLPLIIRKPFYKFIEELFELGLGEPGIFRLIRNKVASNRNNAVINRYMPEEITMAEEKEEESIAEDCVPQQPKWLKGGKLTRPNPYEDEESDLNKTKSKKIADKANSEVKVTEAKGDTPETDKEMYKKIDRPRYSKDAVDNAIASSNRSGRRIGGKEASAIHRLLKGRHEVSEGRDAQLRYDMESGKMIKMTKKASVQAKKDFIAKLWKQKEEKATQTNEDFISEEGRRRLDDPAMKNAEDVGNRISPSNKISAMAKAQRDFDGRQTPTPKTDKLTGTSKQLKLNLEDVMNGEVLDEDVNYRKTPQGMLQTLAGMVKIKKRHGGKVSVNDRKIASKARNELRRRKYFGAGGATNGVVSSSFDPAYLDLADILAEENLFLTDEQLDELKKVVGAHILEDTLDELHKDTYVKYISHALTDRDDHLLNYGAHSMKGNERQAGHALKKVNKRGKGVEHAIGRLHSPSSKTVTKSDHSKPKTVKPSKTTWFKDADDASNVSDVDTKRRVRKEDFETRFAETLELFEVKSISELDEEMTKLFMNLVQNESASDEYQEKVYARIQAAKKVADEKNLSPEQIRYRAEKKARAEKTKSAIDAAKDEYDKSPKGGWSKKPADSV